MCASVVTVDHSLLATGGYAYTVSPNCVHVVLYWGTYVACSLVRIDVLFVSPLLLALTLKLCVDRVTELD